MIAQTYLLSNGVWRQSNPKGSDNFVAGGRVKSEMLRNPPWIALKLARNGPNSPLFAFKPDQGKRSPSSLSPRELQLSRKAAFRRDARLEILRVSLSQILVGALYGRRLALNEQASV